jgi:hypothetical protein
MQPKEFFFSLAATATCADVPTTIWVTGPASARSSVTTFLLVLIMVSKCAYLILIRPRPSTPPNFVRVPDLENVDGGTGVLGERPVLTRNPRNSRSSFDRMSKIQCLKHCMTGPELCSIVQVYHVYIYHVYV